MSRKDETKAAVSRSQLQGLPIVRRNVAGIDLGSEEHWVCAPTVDGTGREITHFGATTSELVRMAEWLKARQVESVAMESTGVYWIAPHEVLEAQGLSVLLVDTRQLAQVPGRDRSTDPTASEWLQRLHSCGLAARGIPSRGRNLHATNAGAGQGKFDGRARRLVAKKAEELRSDERAFTPGGVGHRWRDRHGHSARHREG